MFVERSRQRWPPQTPKKNGKKKFQKKNLGDAARAIYLPAIIAIFRVHFDQLPDVAAI